MSTTSSDLDDEEDIEAVRSENAAAATAACTMGGVDNTVRDEARLPLSNFYMQRVPEAERHYHWIEGNRMTFHRFHETNFMDRRINECKCH